MSINVSKLQGEVTKRRFGENTDWSEQNGKCQGPQPYTG